MTRPSASTVVNISGGSRSPRPTRYPPCGPLTASIGSSASRRMATYRRAARSETPSRSPSCCAVIPGLSWITSSASSARAVGLTSAVTRDPADQRDELPPFLLRQRREQALLDRVDHGVELRQAPRPGGGDRDDVPAAVGRVDGALHQAAFFQLHEGRRDVAAVDPGTAPERRLAGRAELLEGRQQAVVVAAQPVAVGGETFLQQPGGPEVRPADQPRRPLAHPPQFRSLAGRRPVFTHDANLTVVGAANQLIHWPYQRWDSQRLLSQLYGGTAMTAGPASSTLATWRG